MLVLPRSCHRCRRINPGFARYCGLCGVRLHECTPITRPLRGLFWAVIVMALLIFLFLSTAIALRPVPRHLRPDRLIWPGRRVMLNHCGAPRSAVERTISVRHGFGVVLVED